ncbi:MAG TPA: FTR1 family protein, partial [Nitrososphaeraceae archaeon]
ASSEVDVVNNDSKSIIYSEDLQRNFTVFNNLERILTKINLADDSFESGNIHNAFSHAYFPHQVIFPSIKDELLLIDPILSSKLEHLLTDLPIALVDIKPEGDLLRKTFSETRTTIESIENNLINTKNLDSKYFLIQSSIVMLRDAKSVLENIKSNQSQLESEQYYQIINELVNRSEYQISRISNSIPSHELDSILDLFLQIGNYTTNHDYNAIFKSMNILEKELMDLSKNALSKNLPLEIQNYFSKIDSLLNIVVNEIKENKDYKKADKAAISAYLDNYEYLEAPIEQNDPELMLEIELNMREGLRQMIKDKAPSEQIEFFVNNILQKLGEAKNVLLNDASVTTVVTNRGIVNHYNGNPQSNNLADINQLSKGFGIFQGEKKNIGEASEEEKSEVRSDVDQIRLSLQEVLNFYKEDKYEESLITARSAYLDSYEKIELPLRPIDPDFTLEMEIKFAELRNLIEKHASYTEVMSKTSEIQSGLDESERLVSGLGSIAPGIAFSSSFSIIFREGLESALIIGAITTYLEASRNEKFKKHVYFGIILAAGVTAITWFVASFLIEISGASKELIEAIAGISAVAVLFWVSFWILNKIETKKWIEFVKSKVWKATATGSVVVFVMLSFFTVYREGFETVLFYQAMFSYAKNMELFVTSGLIIGLIVIT